MSIYLTATRHSVTPQKIAPNESPPYTEELKSPTSRSTHFDYTLTYMQPDEVVYTEALSEPNNSHPAFSEDSAESPITSGFKDKYRTGLYVRCRCDRPSPAPDAALESSCPRCASLSRSSHDNLAQLLAQNLHVCLLVRDAPAQRRVLRCIRPDIRHSAKAFSHSSSLSSSPAVAVLMRSATVFPARQSISRQYHPARILSEPSRFRFIFTQRRL